MSLDAQDIMGSHHINVGGELYKRRLSRSGTVIQEIKHVICHSKNWQQESGSTSIDLARAKEAYKAEEGCQLIGSIEVNKVKSENFVMKQVPGNFHISSHAYNNILSQVFNEAGINTIDLSHKINHISFGDDKDLKQIKA